MKRKEKLVKLLLVIFIMVFSFTVLGSIVPETEYLQETVKHLDDSQATVMTFSGTASATSLALSALPEDFATPLASTISDLNTYFIFMFAVLFVEKLMVLEGTKIAFVYIIPVVCILYGAYILTEKEVFKNFGKKLLILGIAVIIVIPISTRFTNMVCKDYMVYVDETIAEADAGASKINEVMSTGNEDTGFFERLSAAFKTSIRDVTDLLDYFNNVIKRCINSVAIMLVTTFVVPLLIMLLFRWLLTELFALHLPMPRIQIKIPHLKQDTAVQKEEPAKKEKPEKKEETEKKEKPVKKEETIPKKDDTKKEELKSTEENA